MQSIPESLKFIYLRKGVYERLKRALELLPQRYSLILFDGYRPYQVQASLFQLFFENIKNRNENLSDEEVVKETLKYVAYPSLMPEQTSPHISGGAIDLTIGNSNGEELDLGTMFDEISDKSATQYFELNSKENEVALINRRILFNCMTTAGFQNYHEEWWHFDYGNRAWAIRSGSTIVHYGPILAEVKNNDIKEYQFK